MLASNTQTTLLNIHLLVHVLVLIVADRRSKLSLLKTWSQGLRSDELWMLP